MAIASDDARPRRPRRSGGDVIALPRRAASITIEVEPFGWGFDVRVLPTPAGIGHDREHRTLDDARRYAALLGKVTGWPIVDLVGEAA